MLLVCNFITFKELNSNYLNLWFYYRLYCIVLNNAVTCNIHNLLREENIFILKTDIRLTEHWLSRIVYNEKRTSFIERYDTVFEHTELRPDVENDVRYSLHVLY